MPDQATEQRPRQAPEAALGSERPARHAAQATASEGATPGVGSLLEAFEANAAEHPSRTLFLTKLGGGWTELAYGQFAAEVDAVRAGLHRLGIEAGERVAIIARNSVAWAAVAYACYGLRAALVPMYESQLERDWEHILRDSGARVLFVASEAMRCRLEPLRASLPALRHVIVLEADHSSATREAQGPAGAGHAAQVPTPQSAPAAPSWQALSYAALLRAGEARPWPALRPAPGTPAAFLYTSGTTGEPKGVVLTHGNLWSNVQALKQVALGNERPEQHRALSFLPWAHAFAHTVELHLVITVGASLAIAESIDKVADNLLEVRPTVLVAVPRVFIRIHAGVQKLLARRPRLVRWVFWRGIALARQQALGRVLSPYERSIWRLADRLVFSQIRARFGGRLKFAISGAALLPAEVASFVGALGITVCEGYGLTETSPIVSANVPGMSRIGSVGRPLPGVRVEIQPAGDSAAPAASVAGSARHAPRSGEIVVYGPNVMAGYHNRERETREAFSAGGGFRTGDLGYLDDDGYLYITGRIKEQYKLTNGKYVAPAGVEAALERTPFIAEAMVHGDGRPFNVALIVPDRDALLAWRRERGPGRRLAPEDASQPGLDTLCRDPAVLALVQGELDRVNAELRGYQRVRAFRLLERSFSQEEGLVTPSLKLRRHKIVERFAAELDAMYAETTAATPEPEQDDRLL